MLSEKLLLLRGDDEDHDVLTRGLLTGLAPLAVAHFSDAGRILTKTYRNVAKSSEIEYYDRDVCIRPEV